ncbi:GNAT family N-acetyltransferase [Deinococcus budaensis]|uniref:Aminoglycoside 6'-N-acetyltransferase I n=1 Tax=Deinococcus budaensis TaxID=1665626 RepID=A0A7W8GBZ2_9DEIO|nr:GNAT family N-acetyltransferase [Deinococcus budaensis]MBB5232725.1 aminoglycoside 6'-N-acetyltransferase I [Deinococcus budaensis]
MPDITVRVLEGQETGILDHVAPDVFDGPVNPAWTAEFFADPRHHLAVALDGGVVVGMASAVHYLHPDKAPEMFINEVGVTATHQGQGLGRRLMEVLLAHARGLGCVTAWVLTEPENAVARRLYTSVGGLETPCQIIVIPLGSGA